MRKVSFILGIVLFLVLVCGAAGWLALPVRASQKIAVTEDARGFSVDTGAGLVYTIRRENGDIVSCRFHGTELNSQVKHSQVGMGLGKAEVSCRLASSGTVVILTAATDTLTHYYISRAGENTIYMATYITAEPAVGELRYIFCGNGKVLTQVPAPSNNGGSTGLVEHTEIHRHADGTTSSKYYGNTAAKDLTLGGDTGDGVGVFMAYGSREKSSGGPFYRDIQFQSGGNAEIYNYMNSGHAQTEPVRLGLHGPYALLFTAGEVPAVPDFSWLAGLDLRGWVSERGSAAVAKITGMDARYPYTVGFANGDAQYWTAAADGAAVCRDMIPGVYMMTVYKGELEVYSQSVAVTAGETTAIAACEIAADPSRVPAIWRIGDWDGTPREFLNGANLSLMHPSDGRNADFAVGTFDVGSPAGDFPALQFRQVNSPLRIRFSLTAAQAAQAHRLKIGITVAYNGGRPAVLVNGRELPKLPPSVQPKSRSLTVGTYRGNNHTFVWEVPSADFVADENELVITPLSGNQDMGPWLSAAWAYDCLELDE